MKFTNLQATCECKTLILRGQEIVKCICGRDVHERCSESIAGAFYGPECAKRVRAGEVVREVVPA